MRQPGTLGAEGGPRAAALPEASRQVLRAVDLLAAGMAYVSGAIFLITSFYITADVIGRKFFHISSAVTDEIGGYALAMGGMWALAYALRSGGHVRIDILLPYLPRRVQALLNYAALVVMALFASMVALYTWRLAFDSLTTNAKAMSFIQTPLFVPQSLMAFGFTMLTLEAVAILGVGFAESLRLGRLASLEVLQGPELSEEA
ncbi:MAG: TRAP transporter small permease [Candidatus Rokubacteria bacterium]|nr:TRAP transporter small permease [Candidatus Rokubacteria bacterium]